MKKLLLLLLNVALFLTLAVCDFDSTKEIPSDNTLEQNGLPWEITPSKSCDFRTDVVLRIDEGSLSPTGCTVIMENHTDRDIQTVPYSYGLEIWWDGKWNRISYETDPNVSSAINPTGVLPTYAEAIHWENRYGELPDGKYRLIKGYSMEAENVILPSGIVFPRIERGGVAVEFELG